MEQLKTPINYAELPAYDGEYGAPESKSTRSGLSWQQCRSRRKCYKPFALRTPILLIYFFILLLCIALLEYALHHTEKFVPLGSTSDASSTAATPKSTTARRKRQYSSTTTPYYVDGGALSTSTTSNPYSSSTTPSSSSTTSSTTSTSYLNDQSTSTSTWVTTISFGTDFVTTATAGYYTTEFYIPGSDDEYCVIYASGTIITTGCVFAASTSDLITITSELLTFTTPSPSDVLSLTSSDLLTIATPSPKTNVKVASAVKVTVVPVATLAVSTPSATKHTIPPTTVAPAQTSIISATSLADELSVTSPSAIVSSAPAPADILSVTSVNKPAVSSARPSSAQAESHLSPTDTVIGPSTHSFQSSKGTLPTFTSPPSSTSESFGRSTPITETIVGSLSAVNTATSSSTWSSATSPASVGDLGSVTSTDNGPMQLTTSLSTDPFDSSTAPTITRTATVGSTQTFHDALQETSLKSFTTIFSTETLSSGISTTSDVTKNTPTHIPFADEDNMLTRSMVKVKGTFTWAEYFVALYITPVIGILLKLTWDIVYSDMKLMEPFYRLAAPGGASAGDSILANYLQCGFEWVSIKAMFRGQWAVVLASTIYLLASLVAPLTTESMTVRAQSFCHTPISDAQPCNPAWVLIKVVVRGLEAVLACAAFFVIALTFYNLQRRTGVYESPASIGGVAALLNDRETIKNLQNIDPYADLKLTEQCLAGEHYVLDTYEESDGSIRHGIVKVSGAKPESESSPSLQKLLSSPQQAYTAVSSPRDISSYRPAHPPSPISIFQQILPFMLDILALLFTLALLAIITAYYLDQASDPFNNFFNSNTFGPRITLSLSATLLDAHWKNVEREVRVLTPWRRMALTPRHRPSARAQTSILADLNGTPILSFPRALRRRNLFHAYIALTAVLTDINILCMSGVPANGSTTEPQFKGVTFASISILTLMSIATICVWIWRWTSPIRGIPRTPDTIANVLLYMCASKMVDDNDHAYEKGAEDDLDDTMTGHVSARKRYRNKKFWFGQGVGTDGKPRWMMDWDKADDILLGEVETSYAPTYTYEDRGLQHERTLSDDRGSVGGLGLKPGLRTRTGIGLEVDEQHEADVHPAFRRPHRRKPNDDYERDLGEAGGLERSYLE